MSESWHSGEAHLDGDHCGEDHCAERSLLYRSFTCHPDMKATVPEPIGLPPGASLQAAGEDEAKYSSRNVVVRKLIDRLLGQLRVAAGSTDGTWVDVGVGEGLALEAMRVQARSLIGVEYRHDKLTSALGRLPTAFGVQADAGMLPFTDHSADVVTCLEVLEHLVAPDRAVAELARICHGHCVVSVPWEPYFRLGNLCRGKDIRRWGNNSEHVQQFRTTTVRRLLAQSFGTVSIRPCFPWIIAVAASPR
jgi:ubiquinone/menaquinone biosynthesis C-methylase UbiE